MQTKLCLVFIFILTCSTVKLHNLNENSDTLRLTILIHRHGDRTPISTYPRDPYRNASFWPDGWGELTIHGKQRMYNLGQYLSKRYTNFLGKSPLEVSIRSSGSDRCLQSVSLILAGLYPPNSRWKWNDHLGQVWQPFPIQTVPHDYDGMLNPGSVCKKGKKLIEQIYNSPTVQQYVDQVKSTLRYVEDNTGLQSVDLIIAEEVFDSLLIEKENNHKLPAWVDHWVYAQLQDISAKTFIFSSSTRQVQRLRTGLLLKDILDNLSKQNYGDKRLYIYSTHDTQLTVLLSALNLYDGLAPPFGAAIMFEVHQNRTQEPYLRMFYLNVTESESPFELPIADVCHQQLMTVKSGNDLPQQGLCSLSQFRHMVADLIPDNWEEECENSNTITNEVISVYILTTFLFITICVLIVFIYLFLNNRRHATFYRMLPVN